MPYPSSGKLLFTALIYALFYPIFFSNSYEDDGFSPPSFDMRFEKSEFAKFYPVSGVKVPSLRFLINAEKGMCTNSNTEDCIES